MTQPTLPLREYIFPQSALFPSLEPSDSDTTNGTGSSRSTSTHPFSPGIYLDPTRLPVRVECQDLINHMIPHFKEILAPYETALNLPARMDTWCALRVLITGSIPDLDAEAGVEMLCTRITDLVEKLYFDIVSAKVKWRPQEWAANHVMKIDGTMGEADGEERRLIFWENKSLATLNAHGGRMHKMIKTPFTYDLTKTTWSGWQAILAKLAWYAIENQGRWAIIYGGRSYIIVLIIYVKDVDFVDRPHLYCSPIYPFKGSLSLIAASLYMMMTAELPQDTILQRFGIDAPTQPEGIAINPPVGEDATIDDLKQGKALLLYFKGSKQSRSITCHKNDRRAQGNLGTLPIIELNNTALIGATSHVYKSTSGKLAVKICHADLKAPASEASTSEWIRKQEGKMNGVAEIYGIYNDGAHVIIISAFSGDPIVSFNSLSCVERRSIYSSLRWLHSIHVLHGDIAARNVVCNQEGLLTIIDFSHSQLGHQCEGEELCEELIDAKEQLMLTGHESVDLEGLSEINDAGLSSSTIHRFWHLLLSSLSRYESAVVGVLLVGLLYTISG